MIDTATLRSQARAGAWLRSWHRRVGIALMLVFVVAAISGSTLVYRDAILRNTVAAGISAQPQWFTAPQLARDIALIESQFPDIAKGYAKPPSPERPFWIVMDQNRNSTLLAPVSLQPLSGYRGLVRALDWLRALHVELLLGMTGELVLLASGIGGLFFVISGLVLWWPMRRRLRAATLLPRRMKRGPVLISHRNLGALLAPLVALSMLSGAYMLGRGLVIHLTTPEPAAAASAQPASTDRASSEPASAAASATRNPGMDQLLLAATAALPEGQITVISFPDASSGYARFRMRLPDEWHVNGRTTVAVRASDGHVPDFQRADQLPPTARFSNLMYPLHSAYGLNTVFRLSVFIAGLITLWLSVSGVMSWVMGRSKHRAFALTPSSQTPT